jgi:NTP pyrophosphatase (non-canonical NTP hydrolase)
VLKIDPALKENLLRDIKSRPSSGGYLTIDPDTLATHLIESGWTKMPDIYDNPKFLGPAGDPAEGKEGWGVTPLYTDAETAVRSIVKVCYDAAKGAGWWDDGSGVRYVDRPDVAPYWVATKMMLIVSEISEAMEAHRKGLPDSHLPHRPGVEVELADALIRTCDLAGGLGLDLAGAVVEKMEYNARRQDHKLETRAAAGGKAY